MNRFPLLVALAFALLILPTGAVAQEPADWDVTQSRGETREIDFATDEGTWLSVDISPDGSSVLFDLLGHIYSAPTSGTGAAVSLTQNTGVAVNYHPRYSPDGNTIAFISDQEGQNNLWLMDADGSNQRAVFTDPNVRASIPSWTPDGQYIVVRRSYVGAGSSQGQNGLWMYHVDGGDGVALVTDGGATWPSVSPDGRYVYFQHRQGSADALAGHYQVRRLDRMTGKVHDVTAGNADGPAASRASSGGGFAPEISPDGRYLAYARQIPDGTIEFKGHEFGPRTALWIRDLETGSERLAMDPIGVAIESGSKSLRTLPGYAWSRDGSSIVIWAGGKIRRLNVESGDVATIAFDARVQRTLSGLAYQAFRIEDGAFDAKFMRWHTGSPNGSDVAFQAVGRVWLQAPGEQARRLTPEGFGNVQEFAPTWSPDGRWIAFTTWSDTLGGHVWKAPSTGGPPQRLTQQPGEYVHPAWSADASQLVVALGSGATNRGRTVTHNPWWDIATLPAAGGPVQRIARVSLPAGMNVSSVARRAILAPSWGPDNRVFFPEFRAGDQGLETVLISIRSDGLDARDHIVFPDADEAVPSPDGNWVAFQEGDNVYLTALPFAGAGAEPVSLNKRNGNLPVRRLSNEGGLFPRWRDANTVEFGSATSYYTYDVTTRSADTVSLSLSVERDTPTGTVAFTNARIVTMDGDEVIERGSVVVQGARILCVGTCDTGAADSVIDASGKTIVPGFVDMHSHHYREHRGYRPLRDYEVGIYLSYGVTTSLDNSMWSQNIFPTAELIEAGRMIGPRTYSSGDPMYRGDAARQNDLSTREETAYGVRRLQSWGAVSIKQYQQPRRNQRQWVSDIAREEGLMVTAEGGDLYYNLSMIMDGQTAWEHPLSYVPLYSDAATFFGRAGIVYSPTFVVAGPGPQNIDYFFAESDVWLQERQRRWMPWRMNAAHLRRRMLRPDTDYSFPLIAQGLADIIAEGGYGAIGGHGEHHGVNAHWEIWMAASALGAHEALRVASSHGAHFLGAEEDLGSIEVGKLADLLVLDANPLENIRNTSQIRWVMKGGVIYDSGTLDEVWPRSRPYGPYTWLDEASQQSDKRPVDGFIPN